MVLGHCMIIEMQYSEQNMTNSNVWQVMNWICNCKAAIKHQATVITVAGGVCMVLGHALQQYIVSLSNHNPLHPLMALFTHHADYIPKHP